jgi:hypothetical protein
METRRLDACGGTAGKSAKIPAKDEIAEFKRKDS